MACEGEGKLRLYAHGSKKNIDLALEQGNATLYVVKLALIEFILYAIWPVK